MIDSLMQTQIGPRDSFLNLSPKNTADLISGLCENYKKVWWSCNHKFPEFQYSYSEQVQQENEKKLEKLSDDLLTRFEPFTQGSRPNPDWAEALKPEIKEFALRVFFIKPEHIDYLETCGIIESLREFAKMARQYDSKISAQDIYQAGRNVMTAGLFQLLLGLPVKVSPSIFAYSMLYPYTDNYLDDPSIAASEKLKFNQRFRLRILGEPMTPLNAFETNIFHLVQMIENEWNRQKYPRIYDSLMAIHQAQTDSLSLATENVAPFEMDVLGISLKKGGTSVLADGFLAAGDLTTQQASLIFGFGSFTQLIDDLEDIQQDLREKRTSIFSMSSTFGPLDNVTNHFFNYGHTILASLNEFPAKSSPLLKEIITTCLDPILINTVAKNRKYYGRAYLQLIERHSAVWFSAFQHQQKKLSNRHFNMEKLIELILQE